MDGSRDGRQQLQGMLFISSKPPEIGGYGEINEVTLGSHSIRIRLGGCYIAGGAGGSHLRHHSFLVEGLVRRHHVRSYNGARNRRRVNVSFTS